MVGTHGVCAHTSFAEALEAVRQLRAILSVIGAMPDEQRERLGVPARALPPASRASRSSLALLRA